MNGPAGQIWWRGWQQLFAWFCVLVYRYRAWGLDNVPRRGPFLLVSNHQSFFDPFLATLQIKQRCAYMARETLFRGPFGRLIRSLGAFPVRRGEADVGAIKETLRRLRSGQPVLMFPEGTRSSAGRMGPIRPGVAMLARRAAVPIVPVAIDGAYQAWPRSKRVPRGGTILVKYGRPFQPAEAARLSNEELADALQQRISGLIEQLRGFRQHGERW